MIGSIALPSAAGKQAAAVWSGAFPEQKSVLGKGTSFFDTVSGVAIMRGW
jgi:hypothetical protein